MAWRRLTGQTLSAVLLRRARDFSLHLVADRTAAPVRPARGLPMLPAWVGWAVTVALVAVASLACLALDEVVPEAVLGMVYLPVVVAAAVGFGAWRGLAAAALSFAAWNYLFLSPRYSLTIAGPQELVGAAVFSLVALLLAGTTGGLGQSVRAARARMLGLRRLVEFSRRLGAPGGTGELLEAIAQEVGRVTGRPACVLMPLDIPGASPEPVIRAAAPLDAEPDEASMAAARWALANGRPAGRDTDTLPSAAWQFRPMRAGEGAVAGLAGFHPADRAAALDGETDRTLSALLGQAAVALERAQLMEDRARGAARAETERLRSALLTSLGHDLRTPLTSIRGALETLRGPGLAPAVRDDLLAMAGEETVRLSRYIANILDIVRIENGQIEPRREPVDLAEAAETAIARATRLTGRAVALDAGERLPQPRLDPVLLDQVLGNLLDNALKFSGPQGRVALQLRREGAEVAIGVEDDGPGIPPADLPHVFDPFFRASRTDRVAAGTGLGLAICRGLTQAMGGRIAAESPMPGGGTRVTLRFPV